MDEIVIDLEELKRTNPVLKEDQSLESFGAAITIAMQRMFGLSGVPVSIVGRDRDINYLAEVLSSESSFIKQIQKYGLDDLKIISNKEELRRAIRMG
jgi:hypothetical protein